MYINVSQGIYEGIVKQELTTRQREVFEFLERFINRWSYPPTFAELARGLGLKSKNAVARHLGILERKGWIARDANEPRGIRMLDWERKPVHHPYQLLLFDEIEAGKPQEIGERTAEQCDFSWISEAGNSGLRVVDSSLQCEQIRCGDIVVYDSFGNLVGIVREAV